MLEKPILGTGTLLKDMRENKIDSEGLTQYIVNLLVGKLKFCSHTRYDLCIYDSSFYDCTWI